MPTDKHPGAGPAPGETGQYRALSPEPIEVIEAWDLPHHLACAVKYIARHPRKGGVEDLRKAIWYIQRYIDVQGRVQEDHICTHTHQDGENPSIEDRCLRLANHAGYHINCNGTTWE